MCLPVCTKLLPTNVRTMVGYSPAQCSTVSAGPHLAKPFAKTSSFASESDLTVSSLKSRQSELVSEGWSCAGRGSSPGTAMVTGLV